MQLLHHWQLQHSHKSALKWLLWLPGVVTSLVLAQAHSVTHRPFRICPADVFRLAIMQLVNVLAHLTALMKLLLATLRAITLLTITGKADIRVMAISQLFPFGLTYTEMNAWIRYGGGQELWDELAGEFGLKAIMAGSTGCQAGGWFNKEINSADDFNGLKMRIPGLGGDVIGKLGGSPVTVPGGQIYENLVSGAIDATEWVGAWNDEIMKFYEAAKYYYTAGMHEPGSMIAAGFNAKFWADLSDTDKTIITAAATQENEMMMSEYNGKSGAALQRLKTDHGVQIRSFNEDVWDALAEAAEEVFEEARAHSDLA